MGFPVLRANLEAFQGSDFSYGPAYFGDQAPGTTEPDAIVPTDFSNCRAVMQIRLAQSASSPLILNIDSYASEGTRIVFSSGSVSPEAGIPAPDYPDGYAIYITAQDTLNMGRSEGVTYGNDGALTYYYDLFMYFDGGPSLIWQCGTFQLSPTVTRVIT